MSYSTVENYKDELLKEFVTAAYIAEADEEINDLSMALGVQPTRIPSPCPSIVRKLSIALTYTSIARDKSLMNSAGEDGKDAYALKFEYWAKEVERLKGLITPAALVGGEVGRKATYPLSFPIHRS